MKTLYNFKQNNIRTRDYTLSVEEMKTNRIIGSFNAAYCPDDVAPVFDLDFADSCTKYSHGEVNLIDTTVVEYEMGLVKIVSVIVFVDIYSLQLFILRNKRPFMDELKVSHICGMLN